MDSSSSEVVRESDYRKGFAEAAITPDPILRYADELGAQIETIPAALAPEGREGETMRRGVVVAVLSLLCLPALASGPVTLGVNGFGPLATQAHIGWARISAYWRDIQATSDPNPANWQWAAIDANVNDARTNGQQVLLILSGSPAWATPGQPNANGAYPPTNIALWQTFVDGVSQHMVGRVAAYEIWNEPDLSGNPTFGVGWDRDLTQAPTYVDYFVAAARLIHANAPGTLAVGPVLSGANNSAITTIFNQFENTTYNDGTASSFLDVLSAHADAGSSDSITDAATLLASVLVKRNASNGTKPIWITEFGWPSSSIGQSGQSTNINGLVEEMTGGRFAILFGYQITQAFIYVLHDDGSSRGIYTPAPETPKAVVTGYLQHLTAPAVQFPRPSETVLSPPAGPVGTLVTITGASFEPQSRITVDGVTVTPTYVNINTLRFTAPSHGAGSALIVVLNEPFDAARTSTSKTFTYTTATSTPTKTKTRTPTPSQTRTATRTPTPTPTPPGGVGLSTITFKGSVMVGTTVTGTAVLSGAAPAGGITVSLASSDTSVADVDQYEVTVPAGATSTTFGISTFETGSTTISGTYAGTTKSKLLTVTGGPVPPPQ
ncbi:MAG TPA: IPT/TIG domain-containing protein [Thermoanaerobaculia bacterium]|nr:IPT/TIG domain-containing protein [Thermoanaerobaculia bacterium]